MVINKIGMQHLESGMNCQDYGLEKDGIKLVCDGCSEGKHSEVGAKAYCYMAGMGYSVCHIFNKLIDVFGQSAASIKNFLCFTILYVTENEDSFQVSYCGDGYIILEDRDGTITFEELSDGDYPKYFTYNYCNPDTLQYYQDGVCFSTKTYSKEKYSRVGAASDGLRFIVRCREEELKKEFVDLLKTDKSVKIKRFINRNQKIFKDDITIVF